MAVLCWLGARVLAVEAELDKAQKDTAQLEDRNIHLLSDLGQKVKISLWTL